MAVDIAALAGPVDLAADGAHGLAHGVVAGKKHGRVEVALQHAGAYALGRGVHGHAIIDAHNFRPRLRHSRQELAGADAEMDARDSHAGQDLPGVRQHEFAVVTLVEVAGPGIEKLHGVNAGVDLHLQEAGDGRHQTAHEHVPSLRIGVHEGLGALVVLGWPALNEVAGQRERRANKADECLGFGELGQDAGDALGDLGDVGIQQRQLADVLPTPHRLLHHRPTARHNIDLDARGLERDDDIGEQDGGIDVVAAHRLEGDFCQQFRHEARIEHANPLAGGAVLRQ